MDRINNWLLTLEQQISRRLWPEEAFGSFYLDVMQLADEAASVGDRPHAIASIFIYQQLTEELLYLIDYWCYYEKAIAIYPTVFNYSIPDRIMFGQIIERIKHQQEFPNKDVVLSDAQKLNAECRIPAAHKLLQGNTLPNIEILAENCRKIFKDFIENFNDVRDHFYARYDKLAERTGIQRFQPEN